MPNVRSNYVFYINLTNLIQEFFTNKCLVTSTNLVPPAKRIQITPLNTGNHMQRIRTNILLYEVSLLPGFHSLTTGDLRCAFTCTKHTSGYAINTGHLNAKCKTHAIFVHETTMFKMFSHFELQSPQMTFGHHLNKDHLLNMEHFTAIYGIKTSFPSSNVIFKTFSHFSP